MPRRLVTCLLLAAAVLGTGAVTASPPAEASWAATAAGTARAVATAVPTGPTPTVAWVVQVPAVSRRYTVSWTRTTVGPAPGSRATGYTVERSTGLGPVQVCQLTAVATDGPYSCSEVLLLSAIIGAPSYRVTAQYQGWTGPAGPFTS